jgi:Xaa-Pro aminopeptidase
MVQMKLKSVAVFNSNDIYPIGADRCYLSRAAIFYLSGVDQEESIYYFLCSYEHQKNKYYFKEQTTI